MIPPGVEAPPAMRPVLQHARDAVEANDRALESFLEERLKDLRGRYAGEPLGRFDRCLETLLQKRRIYRQQPTFMYFPYLPAIEFYERSDFPWLDTLEAATDDIRAELMNVLVEGQAALEPYITLPEAMPLDQWRRLNNSRRWEVYFPCGAKAWRCRSTSRAARGRSPRSRRGHGAMYPAVARRRCSRFSMPRPGSPATPASPIRA
jgi:hypothetical protein